MPRIPFATRSYVLASAPELSEQLVNLYAEQTPSEARSSVIIRPTPGLVPQFVLGNGPVAALEGIVGRTYVVSGTHFYRMAPDDESPPEDLGDIGISSTGCYSIAVGTVSVVVCSPPNAYVTSHTPGDTLNQITGDTFPGANSVAYLDGFFVFTATGYGAEFFTSDVLSPTSFDALNFAYADFRPNTICLVRELAGDLWMMGYDGCEIWYDAGNVNFPFLRRPGTDIREGVLSPLCVAEFDGSLAWVGFDLRVYRSEGYSVVRISDSALEEWMYINCDQNFTDVCSYSQNGHEFFCVTFASGDAGKQRTVCYDAETKLWADRNSGMQPTGVWMGRVATNRDARALIGDRYTGALHRLVLGSTTDNGVQRQFTAVLPPLWADTKRGFMSRLELEMEVGDTDALVVMDKSDDGGFTYTDPRSRSVGAGGNRHVRVVWERCGSFRQRVLRFVFASPPTIYGVDVNGPSK